MCEKGSVRTILQLMEQLPGGVAAMAQLPLSAGRKLCGGEADGRDQEEGIVAKTVVSAWGFKELSFHGSEIGRAHV